MQTFRQAAAGLLAPLTGMREADVLEALVAPPRPEMGDLAFGCFPLARERRQAPPAIAAGLAGQLTDIAPFAAVEAAGPYLNFRIDDAALRACIPAILDAPGRWGCGQDGAGRTVVIDYSSPNIAKPLGVHHIRSTMIGAALSRLYAARGWDVVRVNHLGDWGTNFGQLMVAYRQAREEQPDVPVDVHSLLELYKRYHEDADGDESRQAEARAWFRKLEDGDTEARRLWEVFREESLKDLRRLYARMDVQFDHYFGESHYLDRCEASIARMQDAGILEESDGALVVRVEDADGRELPPCLIRKSDGATTYATRDIAAAEHRQELFGFDRNLYVVAHQQEMHFRQVFAVLKRMGHAWADGCEHVKFGMLRFGKGVFGEEAATMSTRRGHVVFLEDVLNRAVEKMAGSIAERRDGQDREDIPDVAESVGVGAVMFSEFTSRRTRDIQFTWEKALNTSGDSGVYLAYSHARLCSLVRRYEDTHGPLSDDALALELLDSPEERAIVQGLQRFPDQVAQATAENEASLLADALLDLMGLYNRMYTQKEAFPIVSDDRALSAARTALTRAVQAALAEGMALLGLKAPARL